MAKTPNEYKVAAMEEFSDKHSVILCYSPEDIFDKVKMLVNQYVNQESKGLHHPEIQVSGKVSQEDKTKETFHLEVYKRPRYASWEYIESDAGDKFTVRGSNDTNIVVGTRERYVTEIGRYMDKYAYPEESGIVTIQYAMRFSHGSTSDFVTLVLHPGAYVKDQTFNSLADVLRVMRSPSAENAEPIKGSIEDLINTMIGMYSARNYQCLGELIRDINRVCTVERMMFSNRRSVEQASYEFGRMRGAIEVLTQIRRNEMRQALPEGEDRNG